jgi:hypothetical protein
MYKVIEGLMKVKGKKMKYIFAVYIQQYNVMMIIQLDILLKYSNLLRIIQNGMD